jgi:hypothetical protein
MKFAGHRNSKTLVGNFLDDMSNVDGAAAFFGLERWRVVNEDLRSASMRRMPGLPQSLPAKIREELEQHPTFVNFSKEIKSQICPRGP